MVQMYLKTHSLSVCIWIFLVHLHRVTSRHAQQTLTLFDQNAEDKENLNVKVKKILEAKMDQKLQDVNSCDCIDYCLDPNSTELQVSFRWKFKINYFYFTMIILVNIRAILHIYA